MNVQKRLAIVATALLVLVSVPILYAKSNFDHKVNVLYNNKIKIIMGDKDEEMKKKIRKISECQIRTRIYRRFDDSFINEFIYIFEKVKKEPVEKKLIMDIVIYLDAFRGSADCLSENQVDKIVNVMFSLSMTNSEDVKQILMILCSEFKDKDCIRVLENMKLNASQELKIQLDAYLLEARFWGEDHH